MNQRTAERATLGSRIQPCSHSFAAPTTPTEMPMVMNGKPMASAFRPSSSMVPSGGSR